MNWLKDKINEVKGEAIVAIAVAVLFCGLIGFAIGKLAGE